MTNLKVWVVTSATGTEHDFDHDDVLDATCGVRRTLEQGKELGETFARSYQMDDGDGNINEFFWNPDGVSGDSWTGRFYGDPMFAVRVVSFEVPA